MLYPAELVAAGDSCQVQNGALSYLATFQKSVNGGYNMRRRSQNLDDIVINSKKIFQGESC